MLRHKTLSHLYHFIIFILFLDCIFLAVTGNFVPLQPVTVFQNGQLFDGLRRKSFPKRITSVVKIGININKQYNGN